MTVDEEFDDYRRYDSARLANMAAWDCPNPEDIRIDVPPKSVYQMRCTSHEKFAFYIELEKATRWYVAWTTKTDNLFQDYCETAMDLTDRYIRADSRRLKAYNRLRYLLDKQS